MAVANGVAHEEAFAFQQIVLLSTGGLDILKFWTVCRLKGFAYFCDLAHHDRSLGVTKLDVCLGR